MFGCIVQSIFFIIQLEVGMHRYDANPNLDPANAAHAVRYNERRMYAKGLRDADAIAHDAAVRSAYYREFAEAIRYVKNVFGVDYCNGKPYVDGYAVVVELDDVQPMPRPLTLAEALAL